MKLVVAGISALFALSACAEQSAMRLSQDTVQLHASTAPIYGALEPQRRIMAMAADETIKNGYDKFIILGGANSFQPNVIGQTAATAQSTGSVFVTGNSRGFTGQGISQSTYTGSQPVAMPRFESEVTIKMFKANDPNAANAIDAREIKAQTKASGS